MCSPGNELSCELLAFCPVLFKDSNVLIGFPALMRAYGMISVPETEKIDLFPSQCSR